MHIYVAATALSQGVSHFFYTVQLHAYLVWYYFKIVAKQTEQVN